MKVTGTVTKVVRTGGPGWAAAEPYRHVTLTAESGNTVVLRYLASSPGRPDWDIARGQQVTIEGMAMMGYRRVNVGGVIVTVHETEPAPAPADIPAGT